MIRERLKKEQRMTGQIYNFMEFQKKKPFFHEPMKITLGHPLQESYIMVKNVVYKEMQILVLKKEQDERTIVLVEAKLKDGQLHYISKISEENIWDISRMLESVL